MDGNVINDAVWQGIAPITDLVQVTPNYGAAVSEHAYSPRLYQ